MASVCAGDADPPDAGGVTRFDQAGCSFVLCPTGGRKVFCTRGQGPQDGAHLARGPVQCSLIECPHEGCVCDLRDGRPRGGPARMPLAVCPARIIGGRAQVDLPG
jgi:nitrite reductase/ring-hydroxylating ferredoxin subunit